MENEVHTISTQNAVNAPLQTRKITLQTTTTTNSPKIARITMISSCKTYRKSRNDTQGRDQWSIILQHPTHRIKHQTSTLHRVKPRENLYVTTYTPFRRLLNSSKPYPNRLAENIATHKVFTQIISLYLKERSKIPTNKRVPVSYLLFLRQQDFSLLISEHSVKYINMQLAKEKRGLEHKIKY